MGDDVDYGPLTGLIGVWEGDKGMDVAPGPKRDVDSPYFETITFEAIGTATNAKSQTLSVLHYLEIVSRKANNKVFHHETGYWMWDPATEIVMHSLTIPRSVCVLAGAKYDAANSSGGNTVIEVSAKLGDEDWGILQSPFMRDNARTTEFRHKVTVGNGKLAYLETMMLDIYGKVFEHTDENELTLQT